MIARLAAAAFACAATAPAQPPPAQPPPAQTSPAQPLPVAPSPAQSSTATQIDALTASPENFRLVLENDRVRVLEHILFPGKKDRRHTHPKRVAHVISGGTLRVGFPDGTHRDLDEIAGTSEYSGPSLPHDTENIGTTPIKILLVEVKDAPKP